MDDFRALEKADWRGSCYAKRAKDGEMGQVRSSLRSFYLLDSKRQHTVNDEVTLTSRHFCSADR